MSSVKGRDHRPPRHKPARPHWVMMGVYETRSDAHASCAQPPHSLVSPLEAASAVAVLRVHLISFQSLGLLYRGLLIHFYAALDRRCMVLSPPSMIERAGDYGFVVMLLDIPTFVACAARSIYLSRQSTCAATVIPASMTRSYLGCRQPVYHPCGCSLTEDLSSTRR